MTCAGWGYLPLCARSEGVAGWHVIHGRKRNVLGQAGSMQKVRKMILSCPEQTNIIIAQGIYGLHGRRVYGSGWDGYWPQCPESTQALRKIRSPGRQAGVFVRLRRDGWLDGYLGERSRQRLGSGKVFDPGPRGEPMHETRRPCSTTPASESYHHSAEFLHLLQADFAIYMSGSGLFFSCPCQVNLRRWGQVGSVSEQMIAETQL